MTRNLRVAIVAFCATLAVAFVVPFAEAQDDYPSGRNLRKGRGLGPTHGYGSYDIESGQKQTLSHRKSEVVHRICVTGDNIKVIADGKVFELDSGDCIDVEAKEVEIENPPQGGEAAGTFETFPSNPRKRRHME